ncbi:MAG TPA: tRNA (adenosine(37)-N6)-threonylcarbamoyltransferase complex ATPase subunit type 1 TsaE [Acidobacteriaceae bacterium]|jgi:tRNA threonylcarbamoyladenosine biosynthesis protein TsaE|nr:tRNA (adenosine(37)-N6)-threonylcarbamoyltransferase complex ATPase subunit type 1 TsaE [Acidobacteriaceae bacterium]
MTTAPTEFVTHSSAETIEVGRKLAALLVPPKFLILRGDLGAGKTTLVKGIAEALDAADADEVTSPTFTLVHEYQGTRDNGGKRTPVRLYHLDLYRIESERQLETLGLDDLETSDSIVLVEWGEKFPSVVKRSQGEIVMTSLDGDKRRITLKMKPSPAVVAAKTP